MVIMGDAQLRDCYPHRNLSYVTQYAHSFLPCLRHLRPTVWIEFFTLSNLHRVLSCRWARELEMYRDWAFSLAFRRERPQSEHIGHLI